MCRLWLYGLMYVFCCSQVIACIIVFTAMNFLKVLFAKLTSSYFHASTHFSKMQEALDKVQHFSTALKTCIFASQINALYKSWQGTEPSIKLPLCRH